MAGGGDAPPPVGRLRGERRRARRASRSGGRWPPRPRSCRSRPPPAAGSRRGGGPRRPGRRRGWSRAARTAAGCGRAPGPRGRVRAASRCSVTGSTSRGDRTGPLLPSGVPNEQRSPVRPRRCPATVVPRPRRASQVACSGRSHEIRSRGRAVRSAGPLSFDCSAPRTTGGSPCHAHVWALAARRPSPCSPACGSRLRERRRADRHGPGTTTTRRGHDHGGRRATTTAAAATFPVTVNTPAARSPSRPSRAGSCRCRRRPPRCSSPSAPARRSSPSTTSPNYPTDAPKTDLSGFTPNLEAIVDVRAGPRRRVGRPGDLVAGLQRRQGARDRSCRPPPRSTTPTPSSSSSARRRATSAAPPRW